ncbi:MAG: alpha/beta hydrolase [Kiritimatiellales bacterium]
MKNRIAALFLSLIVAAFSAAASTVSVIQIPASKMDKTVPATLILPDAYQQDGTRFPVLYLLHGAGGDYTGWNRNSDISRLADQYGFIVVCPDGGKTSWYFDSPIDPTYQYETFVAKDCVEFIDANYRTLAQRESRATCGLSMGGHGALFLAIRHLDTFSVAVALSGGVDIRPFPNNWDIRLRIGDQASHMGNWEKYTVISQAKVLKNGDLAISQDCGTADFFREVNRALHNQLIDAGIDHHYEENPGKHNWAYWKGAIQRQMIFIDQHIAHEPVP